MWRKCLAAIIVLITIPSMVNSMTMDEVKKKIAPAAEKRLKKYYVDAGVSDLAGFPPEDIMLIVLKHEKKLELWVNTGKKSAKPY